MIFATAALIAFYLVFPALLIYATRKVHFLKKVGAVVLAYISGLLVGSVGLIPEVSDKLEAALLGRSRLPASEATILFEKGAITSSDLLANHFASVQDGAVTLAILLAVPMLLFALDIKSWLLIAREALLSLLIAMVALLAAVFAGYTLFGYLIDESWKVTGMLIGLYTGGTPNLAAIATALNVDSNTFLLTHSYDMLTGAVCLVFLMTIAQRILTPFLGTFQQRHLAIDNYEYAENQEDLEHFSGILSKAGLLQVMKIFGLSISIVLLGVGLGMLMPAHSEMVTVILSITALGIFASTIKSVNQLKYSFQIGMYLIIVFSLVVASMGDLQRILQMENLHLFALVAFALLGSIIIHVLLAKIFKIDVDTTIITITALAYSPPFVPVVAGSLNNRHIIISGLAVGILGYAVGNYLGIAVAYLLQ